VLSIGIRHSLLCCTDWEFNRGNINCPASLANHLVEKLGRVLAGSGEILFSYNQLPSSNLDVSEEEIEQMAAVN